MAGRERPDDDMTRYSGIAIPVGSGDDRGILPGPPHYRDLHMKLKRESPKTRITAEDLINEYLKEARGDPLLDDRLHQEAVKLGGTYVKGPGRGAAWGFSTESGMRKFSAIADKLGYRTDMTDTVPGSDYGVVVR